MDYDASLPRELQFLSSTSTIFQARYRSADFLRSPFDAPEWECVFDGFTSFRVSFLVRLDDGQLLTSQQHKRLQNVFKNWLCVQTHGDATGGKVLNAASAAHRVQRTLHVIDFLLLNARHLQLANNGLQLLTANDWHGLILALAQSSGIANGLYAWPTRLARYLKQNGKRISENELRSIHELQPFLAMDIPNEEDRLLDLTVEEIVLARAWLWQSGMYRKTSLMSHRFTLETKQLNELLYADTLRKVPKVTPPELLLCPLERIVREYPAAPTRANEEDRLSRRKLEAYRKCIRRLGLLTNAKLSVPLHSLSALDSNRVEQTVALKEAGRFTTLPHQAVLTSLRHAIEFSLNNGDAIVDACISVLSASQERGETVTAFAVENTIVRYLPTKLRKLGVKTWTIDPHQQREPVNGARPRGPQYYSQLRANIGLWELVRVLFGSVQLTTGALMARRASELAELVAGRCLDKERTRLVFANRKNGVLGIRQTETRPIPKVAARMIAQLERLHSALRRLGLADRNSRLFAYPFQDKRGVCQADHDRLGGSMDFFCDYFETPLDKNGHRYYYRHHQLRRFFAMMFFWSGSFGGMDTLRWFLGHTDMRSLYHYITESTPGAVLRGVKAQFAAEHLIEGAIRNRKLTDLIEARFHTRNVSVLDAEELTQYISDLLADGVVQIEPVFFETPDGESFRVAVNLKPLS